MEDSHHKSTQTPKQQTVQVLTAAPLAFFNQNIMSRLAPCRPTVSTESRPMNIKASIKPYS